MHMGFILSSPFFLPHFHRLVVILLGEKVGNLSKTAANHYVNQKWILPAAPLWKIPVDKSVEIVEKFGFSTGKPEFSQIGQFPGNA